MPWPPAPPAPHEKARSAFRVQSSVLPLFPSPNCQNQARTHLGGKQLTARQPNTLRPAMLPAIPLPSQAVPSPRNLRSAPEGLALHFMCRSGDLTHLLHSPVHLIGVTRGEMGQDSGTINAFPEKGVMLEGRQKKVWSLVQPPVPCSAKMLKHSPIVLRRCQKDISGHASACHKDKFTLSSGFQGSQTRFPPKCVHEGHTSITLAQTSCTKSPGFPASPVKHTKPSTFVTREVHRQQALQSPLRIQTRPSLFAPGCPDRSVQGDSCTRVGNATRVGDSRAGLAGC